MSTDGQAALPTRPRRHSTGNMFSKPVGVFTVDDGPARSVEDPANMGFIVAISRGKRPRELKVRA